MYSFQSYPVAFHFRRNMQRAAVLWMTATAYIQLGLCEVDVTIVTQQAALRDLISK